MWWIAGGWTLIAAALAVASAILSAYLLRRDEAEAARRDSLLDPKRPDAPGRGRPRPWIILNPTKVDDEPTLRAQIDAIAAELGVTHVHWRHTTAEDPGTGQALRALADGASLVIAAGGDGTVRAVAAGMAGSGTRMGIVPLGTGNLMARNLGINVDDIGAAVRTAFGAGHRRVDLGWLAVDDVDEPSEIPAEGTLVAQAVASLSKGQRKQVKLSGSVTRDLPAPDEYAFLVVAGIGFDGQTMADTDPTLKKIIGWPAYVVAALGATTVRRMRARLTLVEPGDAQQQRAVDWDLLEPMQAGVIEGVDASAVVPGGEVAHLEARSVLFANCGELPMVTLVPDATVDDGMLDLVAVDTQAGVVGWANLAGKILAQGLGWKPVNMPTSLGQIAFRQARGAALLVDKAQVVQVDGDPVGSARKVTVRVEAGALDMAVPQL